MEGEFTGTCPRCDKPLDEHPELIAATPGAFDECAFRCEACGVAYSNSKSPRARRLIFRHPEMNVPVEVRAELDTVLASAGNVVNRAPKRWKFCSSRSEDAVTWTVIRGLQQAHSLEAVPQAAGIQAESADDPTVLLWSAPARGSAAEELAEALTARLDELGERAERRSEPDVVLEWPNLLVFIEAKLDSANEPQPHHSRFATYLVHQDVFKATPEQIEATGYYELVRNWVIGTGLAETRGRRFLLINLGPEALAPSSNAFATQLNQGDTRRFVHLTWADLLAAAGSIPEWLTAYAKQKRL